MDNEEIKHEFEYLESIAKKNTEEINNIKIESTRQDGKIELLAQSIKEQAKSIDKLTATVKWFLTTVVGGIIIFVFQQIFIKTF